MTAAEMTWRLAQRCRPGDLLTMDVSWALDFASTPPDLRRSPTRTRSEEMRWRASCRRSAR